MSEQPPPQPPAVPARDAPPTADEPAPFAPAPPRDAEGVTADVPAVSVSSPAVPTPFAAAPPTPYEAPTPTPTVSAADASFARPAGSAVPPSPLSPEAYADRPEVLVGAAFAGGIFAALILKRLGR